MLHSLAGNGEGRNGDATAVVGDVAGSPGKNDGRSRHVKPIVGGRFAGKTITKTA